MCFVWCHQRTRVQIWLYENTKMRIEGQILGFDEYMNLVLDEAEEVSLHVFNCPTVDAIAL